MEYSNTQQRLLHTGSFTGLRPMENLHSYFKPKSHPFCADPEGWGPLSPIRYDFTPCFIDVWIGSVAVFGLLFGPLAIWYLRGKNDNKTPKDVGYWLKQVRHVALPVLLTSHC